MSLTVLLLIAGPQFCSACCDEVTLRAVNDRVRKKPRDPAPCDRKGVTYDLFEIHCHCTVQCTYKLRQRVPDIVTLVAESRLKLQSLGHKHSSSFLFNKLLPHRQNPNRFGGKHVLQFIFAGVPICCELWCQLYGLQSTDSRIKKILAQLRNGSSAWKCDNSATKIGTGWRGNWCRAWCRKHIKKFAEFDPCKLTASLDPDALETRHMIYQDDWNRRPEGSRPGQPLKISRFTDHWRAQKEEGYVQAGVTFQVKKRPPRSGFTCTICQKIMDLRRDSTSLAAREALTFELKQHLQQVVAIRHHFTDYTRALTLLSFVSGERGSTSVCGHHSEGTTT